MAWLLIAVMVVGLLSIPLGLPGLWIIVAVAAWGAISGEIGATVLIAVLLLALVAEIIEFVIVKRLTEQYGGSRKAFWGAIAGGMIGVIVGVPIPVIGSIIAGLIGTFFGAGAVAYLETKELIAAHRVGWGAVVGRALSAVTKTAAGLAMLILTTAALLR